ncbi:MAG: STAS domain-containing protein [Ignavibacteria bacterium]|nr:STAS domain-containing protein [Ignavibacteria bacterium]
MSDTNLPVVIKAKPHFARGNDWSLLEEVRALIRNDHAKFILDLSGMDRINSREIGVIAACVKSSRDAEGELKLCGLNEFVEKVFHIAGMNNVVDSYPDSDAAKASFTA